MTIKEIQQASLEIMLDVDLFCRTHGIRYSIAYGTLIGAIRHKGFIPWDDDIDIVMPRPDYERFLREYMSGGRFYIPDDSYIAFARVCDCEKTTTKDRIPWHKGQSGIWIDIFPIDSVDDDREKFEEVANEAFHYYRKQLRRRKMKASFWHKNTKSKLRTVFNLFVRKNAKHFSQEIVKLATKYEYGATSHCGQLCCPDNAVREYFPSSVMDNYIDVEFEGHKLMAIKDYDMVLRETYGDYMQLPAENERVTLHSHIKFYFKK